MEDYTLETRNLTKRFTRHFGRTSITAVDNISLKVRRGEILGVLGQNGAGKSTLLKMICGLLRPTNGQVVINGRAFEKYRSEALSQIGAVLEGSRNSLWSMTVRQNITYFGYLKNVHGAVLKRRADELLELFQLKDKQGELVKNLSKGMKQKLAIALAFINDPSLILLDEPTLGLDVQTERTLKKLIVRIAKESQRTILLSTHNMQLVEDICDRVAIINKGRLIAVDKPGALLRDLNEEAYLIRLEGRPELQDIREVPGVSITEVTNGPHGEEGYLIRATLRGHDALFDLIDIFKGDNLRILSLRKCEPTLEDVFVKLLES